VCVCLCARVCVMQGDIECTVLVPQSVNKQPPNVMFGTSGTKGLPNIITLLQILRCHTCCVC
jgi:hypothetical protein